MTDYIDLADLLARDLDPETAARLLAASPLSGHDGCAVIEADRLPDLLVLLDTEDRARE